MELSQEVRKCHFLGVSCCNQKKIGFSAGYFNTVGSKEGFVPSTFTSSIEKRAKVGQRVEDFMDEEDRETGIVADVSASSEFGLFSSLDEKKSQPDSVEAAMSGMLERRTENTMGFVLLRKMGWKDGHGIGPLRRVRKKPVLVSSNEDKVKKRVIGPSLSRDEIEEIRAAPSAPRDIGTVSYSYKDDTRGLGYDPFVNAPEFRKKGHQDLTVKRKTGNAAFGLGAFETPDEEDPFAVDDPNQYDRAELLDFSTSAGKRGYDEMSASSNVKRCSDGRLPLKGFVLGKSVVLNDVSKIPNISVPPGWKPKAPLQIPILHGQPSPVVAQWVFAATQRSLNKREAYKKELEKTAKSQPLPPKQPEPIVPKPAQYSLPFAHDHAKQQRYQNWLLSENGLSSVWRNATPPSDAEVEEFKQVKQSFNAVPAGMSDRFAPSGAVIEESAVNVNEVAEEFRKYGEGTTRTEEDWAPASLLCRRWGISDPFLDREKPDSKSESRFVNGDIFPSLSKELERQFGESYRVQMREVEEQAIRAAEREVELLKQSHPDEEFETIVKPDKDVFASVFGGNEVVEVDEEAEKVIEKIEEELFENKAKEDPGALDFLSSVFAGVQEEARKQQGFQEPSKKSKTQSLLEKNVVLSDWIESEAKKKDKKKHKKKKKKDKKKEKKKEHKKSKK